MTIPNLVTMSGIIATGFYVFGYLSSYFIVMTGTVSWVIFSDALDGFLARRLNQRTTLGAFLDPLRDQLLLVATIGNVIFLKGVEAVLNKWVVAILVIELDILVFGVIIRVRTKRRALIKVHLVGKLRYGGYLILIGFVITSSYFNIYDVELTRILKSMAALSFAALVFYLGRAWTIFKLPA